MFDRNDVTSTWYMKIRSDLFIGSRRERLSCLMGYMSVISLKIRPFFTTSGKGLKTPPGHALL
jgi:hypothetical protein